MNDRLSSVKKKDDVAGARNAAADDPQRGTR
jgi:hypothetical protein